MMQLTRRDGDGQQKVSSKKMMMMMMTKNEPIQHLSHGVIEYEMMAYS